MLPRIIGRPADAEQLIIRAGQRAEEVQRAAAADIERSLLAEAGTDTAAEAAAAEAAGGGILEGLAAAGGAAAEGAGAAAAAAFPIAEGLGMAAGVATGGVAALAGGAADCIKEGAGCYQATAGTLPRARAANPADYGRRLAGPRQHQNSLSLRQQRCHERFQPRHGPSSVLDQADSAVC